MDLRDYQHSLSEEACAALKTWGIVYLAMQVRTGKTATALNTAKLGSFKNVLFLTKKIAIKSIITDSHAFGFDDYMNLTVINNESLHTIKSNDFDLIIIDEAQRLGSFPKPNKMARDIKERFAALPMIFLSGTPTPESYMQIFHQFWVSDKSPFKKYGNFYKWFKEMGFVKTSFDVGYGDVANYSNSIESIHKYYSILKQKVSKDDPKYIDKISILEIKRFQDVGLANESNDILKTLISLFTITYTQKEAGFETEVNEHILYCDLKPSTYKLCRRLLKDRVIEGKKENIVADTAVKLQQKLHQMYSGTVKFEPKLEKLQDGTEKLTSGASQVLDHSKAEFIKEHFKGKKLGIFYKFKAEWNMLRDVFGDKLTDSLDEFNATNKHIALQIVSGREGISLKSADYLVYLNIDFSALSYWQSRDRLTTMERKTNDIYWIFSKNGIEDKIYKAVQGKKSYTTSVFKKDFSIG